MSLKKAFAVGITLLLLTASSPKLNSSAPFAQFRDRQTLIEQIGTRDSLRSERKCQKGMMLLERGKNKKALASFERALKADSTNANALVGLGTVFLIDEKIEKSIDTLNKIIEIFTKAIELQPNNPTPHAQLSIAYGILYKHLKNIDPNEADRCLQKMAIHFAKSNELKSSPNR